MHLSHARVHSGWVHPFMSFPLRQHVPAPSLQPSVILTPSVNHQPLRTGAKWLQFVRPPLRQLKFVGTAPPRGLARINVSAHDGRPAVLDFLDRAVCTRDVTRVASRSATIVFHQSGVPSSSLVSFVAARISPPTYSSLGRLHQPTSSKPTNEVRFHCSE